MTTRRDILKNVTPQSFPNAGLWLDKYLKTVTREDTASKHDLVREVCNLPLPNAYAEFFREWKDTLHALEAATCEAKVTGRMAVGLGADSVLETSVMFHRTYGVPLIPGSALKGLAAHYCRNYLGFTERWGITRDERGKVVAVGDAYKVVFGDTDEAGYITFFDALYIPETGLSFKGRRQVLFPDVMTPHHSDYYGDRGQPPADWDNPTPVPFLSATGCYLIALGGEGKWVDAVFQILKKALAVLGIGAKTSSGYGRLQLDLNQVIRAMPLNQPIDPQQVRADDLIRKIDAVRENEVSYQLGSLAKELDTFQNQLHQRRIAFALFEKVKISGWKKAKEKPWFQLVLEILNR